MASRPLSSLPGTRSSPDVCSPDVPRRAVAAMTAGPYETERQAAEDPAVRTAWAAWDADPGVAKMAPHNARMLDDACIAAGVELGAYDRRILAWLAGWEPSTVAVVCGLISGAYAAGQDGVR